MGLPTYAPQWKAYGMAALTRFSVMPAMMFSGILFSGVSVAHSADAMLAVEPEPMDYVRVCDTYGAGFYYMPGTETCLKTSGYVRFDVGAGSVGNPDVLDRNSDDPDTPWQDLEVRDTYDVLARFQFRLDARSETELGTLRAYAAANFQYETTTVDQFLYFDNGYTAVATSLEVEHAYLELGGFRVGKTDSLFTTFTGYSGGVINDDIIGYGPYDTHQVAYGWRSDNGLSLAVALETGAGSEIMPFQPPYENYFEVGDAYSADSYLPHLVGGIGWDGSWGGVSLVAGYDSVWEQGAVKGRVDFYPNDRLALFAMAGWASVDEDNLFNRYMFEYITPGGMPDSPNYFAPWGGEWAVWAGASFKATDKATMNFQASYDQLEDIAVVANVAYEVVPNFVVTPEIVYMENLNEGMDDYADWNWGTKYPVRSLGVFVRAQANFGG